MARRATFVLVSAHIAASAWTGIETALLPPLRTVWTFFLFSAAEDKRFELLRGCPNTLSKSAHPGSATAAGVRDLAAVLRRSPAHRHGRR
jgi:hypothetical protein